MSTKARHPMQPIVFVRGVARFKPNKIVRFLLDHGGYNLCQIESMGFSKEDYEQFIQLIGWSVCCFGELEGSVSKRAVDIADAEVERLLEQKGK